MTLRRTSCTAIMSKRRMTSAMHTTECQSLFGESFGPACHISVKSPNALMFYVATVRAGIT
ncbi:hypothetical protein AC20117_22240 (plasmid) [Arthrobacter crystallopoietes]|nr:hypothetical protein AC20117_22240 [Arthrobacter crystallopoietes]